MERTHLLSITDYQTILNLLANQQTPNLGVAQSLIQLHARVTAQIAELERPEEVEDKKDTPESKEKTK
jgi:hypothetical protein